MDFHLERGLRLHTQPEHKNLYSWAINEIDAQGRRIGDDQIPWVWTLYFTATSCVLGDSISIKSKYASEETALATPEIAQRQVILVQLRPRDDGDFRETTFSMFGTDRAIKSFQLEIHQITDSADQESCTAWGTVSYTTEVDFRNQTIDDCVLFYLFVKPETFARYSTKVSDGSVDEIGFRVGSVTGFYSEWSPSISTSRVKVLTKGSEHQVQMPRGIEFEPPRLGDVGAAELYINRRLEFAKRAPDPQAVEETVEVGTVLVAPRAAGAAAAAADSRTLQMLGSLRRAAWFVVVLLVLIFITTLLKR